MRRAPVVLLALAALACDADTPLSRREQDAAAAASAPEGKVAGFAADEARRLTVNESAAAPATLPSDPLAVLGLPADAMLVRTGSASVEVDSLGVALARANELARRLGGFVAGTQAQAGRGTARTALLELRVPTPRFDELVQGLGGLGLIETVQVSTEEVGEEFTDVAARVANGKRLESRLLDLLAARTGKLQDALTVERELARVREEIERHEARLRYLQSRAATSRLTLSVHEPLPVLAGPSPIGHAARQAWRNFVELVAAGIASLGVLVPLGLVAAGAWAAWSRRRRPAYAATHPVN